MLPSTASPTRGNITTATISDSMVTTMPRRPRRLSEDFPVINSCPAHVTSPRKIGRAEIRLGQVGYLASRQGEHAAEARRTIRNVGEVGRRRDIAAGADDTCRGSSERTGK